MCSHIPFPRHRRTNVLICWIPLGISFRLTIPKSPFGEAKWNGCDFEDGLQSVCRRLVSFKCASNFIWSDTRSRPGSSGRETQLHSQDRTTLAVMKLLELTVRTPTPLPSHTI